jgi:hypothetical protein
MPIFTRSKKEMVYMINTAGSIIVQRFFPISALPLRAFSLMITSSFEADVGGGNADPRSF